MTNWFQPAVPVKPPPKKRQPLPAAVIERCCDLYTFEEEVKPQKFLYVSQLARISDIEEMKRALISFWLPVPGTKDYTGKLFTEVGKLIEDIYVSQLVKAGVAKCTSEECIDPKEQHSLRLLDLGVSGRIDAIVDFNKAVELGAKTVKEREEDAPDTPALWVVNEVKSTGSEKYKYWTEFEKLSIDYLSQFSFYCHFAHLQGLISKREGFFTIINRDRMEHRTLWGEPVNALVEKGIENAKTFWQHVRNRTIPNMDNAGTWIAYQIKEQPDRDWNELAEIS